LPPLSPAHHHINRPAAAAGTDEPPAPIEDGRFDAAPSSHLGEVGLDLMPAILAQTINRTLAAAALPSVIGGPGADFT
jgi:hypothetical protein